MEYVAGETTHWAIWAVMIIFFVIGAVIPIVHAVVDKERGRVSLEKDQAAVLSQLAE